MIARGGDAGHGEGEAGACPICADPRTEVALRVTRKDLGGLRYAIRLCRSCDFRFAVGPVDPQLMARIYSTYFYSSGQQTAAQQAAHGPGADKASRWPVIANSEARVAWLRKLGLQGRLLDIGAGRGYFVRSALRCFEANGIELQAEAAAFARQQGIPVLHADFMAAELPAEHYDLVTLWDVFAGFTDPHLALDRIMRLVRPGGHVVLTVPDASSRVARMLRSRWPLLIPPGNMQFHSPRSLARLLDRSDVRRFECEHQGKAVSAPFLLHKLLRALGWHRLAASRFPIPATWSIPLNLYDILTVRIEKSASSTMADCAAAADAASP
jgi:SAM-dependent methyltransferase